MGRPTSELIREAMEAYRRGRRAVTPDTALRLERVTGASAALWLGLQQDWDLWHAERGDAARAIAELVPLSVVREREVPVDPDS